VQRAAADCAWLAAMVEAGEIFHALRFTAAQARRFLADVPRLEAAGIVVRMPAGWSRGRPPRPHVTARVGEAAPAGVGVDAILDFAVHVTLEGERLTAKGSARCWPRPAASLLRGRWVEVDHERLGETIARLKAIEAREGARALVLPRPRGCSRGPMSPRATRPRRRRATGRRWWRGTGCPGS
jgi:non-specific serine/threonine protein kinase